MIDTVCEIIITVVFTCVMATFIAWMVKDMKGGHK